MMGELFLVLAQLLWVMGSIVIRKTELDVFSLTPAQFIFGALLFLPLFVKFSLPLPNLRDILLVTLCWSGGVLLFNLGTKLASNFTIIGFSSLLFALFTLLADVLYFNSSLEIKKLLAAFLMSFSYILLLS